MKEVMKMKKILSLVLILACFALLLAGCGEKTPDATTAAQTTAAQTVAETTAAQTTVEPAEPQTVLVTIADKNGEAVLKLAEITATDLDEDGKVTIYEALKAAHATCPNGGADGFAAEVGQYGLSMVKLWGDENGGSFGYHVNDASAWSLADEVHTGDRIVAFAYTDLTGWSDTFCYFDQVIATKPAGETVEITLTAIVYDMTVGDMAPKPVEGAKILVNGVDSGLVTDDAGKATLTLEIGVNEISATSETMTLVPPIAKITVE